jgi:hypothetical protein
MIKSQAKQMTMKNKTRDELYEEAKDIIDKMSNHNNIMIILMVFLIIEFFLVMLNTISKNFFFVNSIFCYVLYFYHRYRYKMADKRFLQIMDELEK